MRLAELQPDAVDADAQAEMTAVMEDENAPVGARVSTGFALGVLLEKQKKYDEAFAAFALGNRLRRENLTLEVDEPRKPQIAPPDSIVRADHPDTVAADDAETVALRKRLFTREFVEAHEGLGHDSAAPIFVLGLPRSGSTLIEQILSSHGKVMGLGETNALFKTLRGHYPHPREGNIPP